jgi:hypothetical protein
MLELTGRALESGHDEFMLLNTSTGCTAELTRRGTPGVRFEYRKGPESIFVDRTCPIVTDRTRHRVRSPLTFCCPSRRLTRRAGPASDQTHRWQTLVRAPLLQRWTDRTCLSRPVTSTSASGHYQWPPFTSVSIHDDLEKFSASGVVENMHFTSTKAPNPAELARREGERAPNPSLPLKLHRLRKCANTTKSTMSCECVLVFSQSFSRH